MTRLKFTHVFRAVYRRGRWAKGSLLSVGGLPNEAAVTRVGLRTKRGLKGAVVRNRLKRQLRGILERQQRRLRTGLDLVIVIHPPTGQSDTPKLETELISLCKRLGALGSC